MSVLKMAPRRAPGVTTDSILSAKVHQQEERQPVYLQTGMRITDAPITVTHAPALTAAFTIICPRCLAPSGGATEGQAHRVLARHLVTAHMPQGGAA